MSDGFNARNEIKFAFNNPEYQGKLTKEDIENFELEQPLFNKLSLKGENYTLSSKESNGKFKEVSVEKFKKFINSIAKECGINPEDVADDAELMFKILDKDGNGILEADELQALKDSDANESKNRKNKKDIIDGFTLRRYFNGIEKEPLLKELSIIEDLVSQDEVSNETAERLAIKHDVEVKDIKELQNEYSSSETFSTIDININQITKYAGTFKPTSTIEEIKVEMQSIYSDKSDDDLEKLANQIKNVAGTRTYNEDGSYCDVKRNANGERITEETYCAANGDIKYKNTYKYNDDGSYTITQKPLNKEVKRQRPYDEAILKDGYGEYYYDKDNKLTGYRIYNKDKKLYHTNDITYYENTLNNEPQRKHAISKWHNAVSGILEVSYENNYNKENGDITQTYKEYDKNEKVTYETEFKRDKFDNPI